jgi:diguanylate cyclase (GGDEF)-like protein
MNIGQAEHSVLIVEDDEHTRELLNFNLTEAGYQVFEAPQAAQALSVLGVETIDLIISDVMLPGSSGFELREGLMNDPAHRDIAFMFLTAKSLAEDQIRGIQSGADEYITKPFDIEVLLARVSAVIARREHFARVASIDPLTGLLNRQALERAIGRELSRLRRYPAVASLIFLDIDNFKSLNDQYGHATGDEVLRHLSDVLRQHSRAVDIVGRFGGEEFVLFFPQTSEDEGCFVLERMQDHFRSANSFNIEQALTFSAGLAEAPRDGDVFEGLCARADAAMYYSKRHGKAQVIPWRPAHEEEESAPH